MEEITVSDRGFKHGSKIEGSHRGGYVKVYESSAASGPHLWLLVQESPQTTGPDEPAGEATIHPSLEAATELRDQLTFLIANHYQEV